jgi:thiosulfate/3-mercaptopyruvate sulfurtransferase
MENRRQALRTLKRLAARSFTGLSAIPLFGLAGSLRASGRTGADDAAESWNVAQLVQPAGLVRELAATAKSRPLVVCAGFDFLYQAAHVPGAVFYGPAREPAGLQRLNDAARSWPRDRDIVVYCGCCPFSHCPNVRPAFTALKRMGFTRLRVLDIEHDFRTDWLKQGYPVEQSLPPTK